jgi:thiamine pyrophosphokinase
MTASPVGRALVLADGDEPTRAGLDAAWPGWDDVDLVVAADGGARLAGRLGLRLDRWVGDADSIDPDVRSSLEAAGVPMDRVAVDKDESDTELALLGVLGSGASDVTILGGLGGRRFDHTLANLGLLAHPALHGRAARLLDDTTRVRLLAGPGSVVLEGRTGDLVSLLPVAGAAEGVTTDGLRYPLRDEPLIAGPARGLSNVRTGTRAVVSIRAGRVLIVETLPPDRPATVRA